VSLEELHNLKEELKKAQAELKQFMNTTSRAAATTTTRTLSASSNVNVHLLHEKIVVLERERSEMKSIVAEVILQLEGLSNNTKEEEGKEPDLLLLLPELESDNVFAIYERLRKSVGFINPLKHYVLQTHAEKKNLKADLAILENEHRMEVTLMAQARRRAADALHFKENEIKRLKEQVEALESEVMEAQQLAQAHDTLSQASSIRDIHIVGVSNKSNSYIGSYSLDGSMMDDGSTFSNAREKMRKRRESASRFLHRFQGGGSPGQKKNRKSQAADEGSPILELTVNKPVSDEDYGDSCSVCTCPFESITEDRSQSPVMSLGGGGSKDCADEFKTDDEDEDGDGSISYVIPNFLAQSPSSTARSSGRTILKRDPLKQIPVDTRRKSWKKLPAPNLDKMGNSTRSVTSCTESSCASSYDDDNDDISSSSQSRFSASLADSSRSPTRIRFESVQIRLYHQTLGDNPAVTYGPPITLDWKYDEMSPVKVDEYEGTRGDRISDSNKLFLSSMDRRRVLKNKGFSEDEIDRASLEAEKARKERAMTNALLPAMRVEEVLQSTRRKVKRLIKKKSK
jgi:hypothetical protein